MTRRNGYAIQARRFSLVELLVVTAALGPPGEGGVDGPEAANLIPVSLASGEKDGYLFVLTSNAGGYTVVASPKVFGSTGRRTFYLDQDGIVHENWGPELASAGSPEFK